MPGIQLPADPDFIMVKSGTEIHKIMIDDILFIESAGNYVTFVIKKKKNIMSLFTMNEVLRKLPSKQFYRVHKSYIVSVQHISTVERHVVNIGDREIPIGDVYRESFFKAIQE